MNVKGVNLGNWLVLEKWMSPHLFDGTDAQDEYWLPRRLPRNEYEARIKTHRNEYITERDFVTIKSWGLNCVRIPVPYFVFGDREPFIGCVEHLDKAFDWAEKHGLQILIDLHTAPFSQNGFDNGGICGVCKWSQMPDEVDFVLSVLGRLAERYGMRPGLWGIQILNEPMLEKVWIHANVQKNYPPVDEDMARGSRGVNNEFLRHFYIEAHDVLRRNMGTEKYIVFHDGFDLMQWKDFMRGEKYKNVVLDTHMYLVFAAIEARNMGFGNTVQDYQRIISENFAPRLSEMEKYFPVICGEWCLCNPLVSGQDAESLSPTEQKKIYQAIAKAQLDAWKNCSGYFYWSYKLLQDTTSRSSRPGWESWDMGRCIDSGWLCRDDL